MSTPASHHQHVVNVSSRSLLCTCRPCYLLFSHDDATLAYRAVPDRHLAFPALACPVWEELELPVGWSLEAPCRMPVSVWHRLMDLYFPGSGWIRLDRETIDALARYKAVRGLTSWDETIAQLLPARVQAGSS